MWWFDARQQFGVLGLALAVVGVVRLWAIARPWATFVILAYAINTLFAFTYNVGDTHVFYLPSHFFTALLAGVAIAQFGGSRRTRPTLHLLATMAVVSYAGWRAWDTWPAIDRHDDRRAWTELRADVLASPTRTGQAFVGLPIAPRR
jgi:peptidoglycan/LPS O-acetylase OafA/YrhL